MSKWMCSLLLFILIFSISSLRAQYNVAISAGFNAGHSQLYNVDYINTTNKKRYTTFYAGLIPSYKFGQKIKVSSELQYSEVGTYFRIHNFTPENDIKFYGEGRYLRLIPQLEILVFKNLYVNAGPDIGLMIDGESTSYGTMRISKDMPNYGDMVSNFDMGASVGMKYYIDHFYINVSYYHGFTDISNISYTNQLGEIIPNTYQLNHYLQFGLGARIFSSESN